MIEDNDNKEPLDLEARQDASVAYINNNAKEAVNLLIQRINQTKGNCDYRIWLMLMDIYQMDNQQVPYEHLALLFSRKFNYSPPTWVDINNIKNKVLNVGEKSESFSSNNNNNQAKENKASVSHKSWRNILLIAGSPLKIQKSKEVDFLISAKKEKECKLDLSRLKLSVDNNEQLCDEINKLLDIFYKIKKIHSKTLLMGEGYMFEILKKHIHIHKDIEEYKNNSQEINSQDYFDKEKPFWLLMLEILQWRGEEKEFESLIDSFVDIFEYCPVGFNEDDVIAINPTNDGDNKNKKTETDDEKNLSSSKKANSPSIYIVSSLEDIITYMEKNKFKRKLKMDFSDINILSMDDCHQIIMFIKSLVPDEALKEKVSTEHASQDFQKKELMIKNFTQKLSVHWYNVNEVLHTLFDTMGISDYIDVVSRHDKLYKKLK